jgi:hypothetical protein
MHSPWRLDQRRATLDLGPLKARIDLDQPALGLQQLTLAEGAVMPQQILGVELPPIEHDGDRFVEAYLRGDDLIATYADVAQPSFRWQVYWRALLGRFPQALAAIEAIVSVQTGLLDSWPQLTLRSSVTTAGAAVWRAGLAGAEPRFERFGPDCAANGITAVEGWGCFGFKLPGVAASYVEMVHPADFDSTSVETLAVSPCGWWSASLRHLLFRERLEKGVILRSRVLALILPEEPTSGTIADILSAFVDEELPLTT